MTHIYNATLNHHERRALRLMIEHLSMEVIGEASNWSDLMVGVSLGNVDAVIVDWDLLVKSGHTLPQLRSLCPPQTVLVLVSNLTSAQQATIASGADLFIYREDTPDRVAQCLR